MQPKRLYKDFQSGQGREMTVMPVQTGATFTGIHALPDL